MNSTECSCGWSVLAPNEATGQLALLQHQADVHQIGRNPWAS